MGAQQAPVVLADSDLFRQPSRAVDTMSTAQATRFALQVGARLPTDVPDWELLVRAEPDGSEPLVWVLLREGEADSPE